ncbi:MAG: hypothetical protein IJS99_05770, partial [Synergistaceae bacterium]|nr:hypothetical protein [Synergistaceae bacterium]
AIIITHSKLRAYTLENFTRNIYSGKKKFLAIIITHSTLRAYTQEYFTRYIYSGKKNFSQ